MEPAEIDHCNSVLTQIAKQVSTLDGAAPGGALLGPRLVLAASIGRLNDADLVRVGTAVELLRRAALVHRQPETEDRWPGHGSIVFSRTLLGDLLLAESYRLLSEGGDPDVGKVLSRAMARVSESEIMGSEEAGGEKIRRAAAYFEGAAATGAILSKLGPIEVDDYARWGRAMGVAHERALGVPGHTEPSVSAPVAEPLAQWVAQSIGEPDRAVLGGGAASA